MSSPRQIRYSGLFVAFSGFAITRLFVAETLRIDATLPFLIVGLVPLVVGLTLTVYGVALAIGPFSSEYVRTVARWNLLGVGSMGLIFAITAVDQLRYGDGVTFGYDGSLLVANVLLGGAVGGTLTGIRTGRLNRQRRAIKRSANRALLVNRLLRHEVLNAVTIIGGHASFLTDTDDDRSKSMTAIQDAVRRIKATIEEVGTITKDRGWSVGVDLETVVREEIDGVEAKYGVSIPISVQTDDAEVAADERAAVVVRELLENAVVHGNASGVAVELTGAPHAVELSVIDDGPGLPEPQRALLERDTFPESDDPTAGFGLQIVQLITFRFGGRIRVHDPTESDDTTRITVVFPRTEHRDLTAEAVGISFPHLHRALLGGVLGGIVMGVFYQFSTGLLPVIGSLYGIQTPLIGWITHLFHSAVFGLLFAAICAEPRVTRFVSGPVRSSLLGLSWGTVLWLVAAGLLMPLWLSLLGVSARIPTLSIAGFVGHALWGAVLGLAYWGVGEVDIRSGL